MGKLPSVFGSIIVLALTALVLVSLGWLGVMPVLAVQVMVNTLLIGDALFLFADILLNARMEQRH